MGSGSSVDMVIIEKDSVEMKRTYRDYNHPAKESGFEVNFPRGVTRKT